MKKKLKFKQIPFMGTGLVAAREQEVIHTKALSVS